MKLNKQLRLHPKDLYIDSAIEIIKNEGFESITVRKLSELTGYTFPSLYHHFTDLSQLMLAAKNKMVDDMVPILLKESAHGLKGLEGLKETLKIYTSYFIENPNIFKFFYYYPFPKATEDSLVKYKSSDFDNLWSESFRDLIADGTVHAEDVNIIAKTIIYSIHGMITIMFSKNGDLTERNILDELDRIIELIINKK